MLCRCSCMITKSCYGDQKSTTFIFDGTKTHIYNVSYNLRLNPTNLCYFLMSILGISQAITLNCQGAV